MAEAVVVGIVPVGVTVPLDPVGVTVPEPVGDTVPELPPVLVGLPEPVEVGALKGTATRRTLDRIAGTGLSPQVSTTWSVVLPETSTGFDWMVVVAPPLSTKVSL